MSTEIVLLQRVENLGEIGDVVKVRPGYARNYLLPQRKALRASKENMAYFEARKKQLLADNDKKRADAEKVAAKLKDLKVPLIRQASEAGQLFGSVTARDIAVEASKASGETIDRTMVQLNQNFKLIGLFPVDVLVHPEVKVAITINIARTTEEAEIQAKTGKALIAENEASKPTRGKKQEEKAVEVDPLAAVLEDSALEAQREKDIDASTANGSVEESA
ncbi:MAG: 50S ribosomal protein L9 [Alphaproteobacteria bacterium]|nr:50S ribosomal protein L9 [Alphaproteobacteria bacterium]